MFIIDDTELTRCYAMYLVFGLHVPMTICCLGESALQVLRCVTYLEGDRMWLGCLPRIAGDEVEIVHGEVVLIDTLWVVAMRDKEDVALEILLDHKPRTTTKAKSFALTYSIEP